MQINSEQLAALIMLSIISASIFIMLLFYRLYQKSLLFTGEKKGLQIYKEMEERFVQSRIIDQKKLQLWLKSIGAGYFVKGFDEPFFFLAVNTILSIGILLIVSLSYSFTKAVIAVVFAITAEFLLLTIKDDDDNDNMIRDIYFLCEAVSTQLSTNVYIVHAIANCIDNIKNRRLQDALVSLCDSIAIDGDIKAAAEDFKEKFNNAYLDTFCNMIVQTSIESGTDSRIIEDISTQLAAMHEMIFEKRKKATEMKLMFLLICMFITAFVVIFYLAIFIMTNSVGSMF